MIKASWIDRIIWLNNGLYLCTGSVLSECFFTPRNGNMTDKERSEALLWSQNNNKTKIQCRDTKSFMCDCQDLHRRIYKARTVGLIKNI